MDDLLRLGKQVLASQPFSVLVGAELTGFSPGRVELSENPVLYTRFQVIILKRYFSQADFSGS